MPRKLDVEQCTRKYTVQQAISKGAGGAVLVSRYGKCTEHFLICLSDKDISNPKVYTTDHEVFFREIEELGRFSDFLDLFVSEDEYKVEINKLRE